MATNKPRIQAYVEQSLFDSFKAEQDAWGLTQSEALERILAERYGRNENTPSSNQLEQSLLEGKVDRLDKLLQSLDRAFHFLSSRVAYLEKAASELPGDPLVSDSELAASELPGELQISDSELPASELQVSDSELPGELPVSDGELPASELPGELPVSDGELPASELPGELPVSDSELPASELPGELPVSDGELRVTNYELPVSDSNLLVSNGELPVSNDELSARDSKLVICKVSKAHSGDQQKWRYFANFKEGFVEQLDQARTYYPDTVKQIAGRIAKSPHKAADGEMVSWRSLTELEQLLNRSKL